MFLLLSGVVISPYSKQTGSNSKHQGLDQSLSHISSDLLRKILKQLQAMPYYYELVCNLATEMGFAASVFYDTQFRMLKATNGMA